MGRIIKINITPSDFEENKGKTIKMKITNDKPQYLTPRAKAHLV